ncbi:MAG: hypothetical protein H6Q36_1703 [Chloroflexi bacterium]|jgi:hypothetical protein|nr:hypothetical protein [Chloroflexota bacterium]
MATRADFSDEEWLALRVMPHAMLTALQLAAPSGWLGSRRERKAGTAALQLAERDFGDLPLVEALMAAREEPLPAEATGAASADEALALAETTGRKAMRALERVATAAEREAWVNSVLDIGDAVARASRERHAESMDEISEPEAIVLRRVARVLGRDDYEPVIHTPRGYSE